ncbi:MAG: Gfo/Idh/MocA family protein [Candidatus Poribacteria bacterium]
MYKSAFLGCGGRARGHADAYRFVKKGKGVAICDLNEERLNAFSKDFGIEKKYTDIHEMLDKEKPDLLHIVTLPTLRVPLMTIAAEHEVPIAIVEKPIAIQGEDWKALKELSEKSKTKFVVNTQLHFHPDNLMLKRDVYDGKIGDIRFVDISARSTILDQGVHVLELCHSYINWAKPTKVFAQVSGAKNIPTGQPSPDTAEASIYFDGEIRAQMLCGYYAPKSNPSDSQYMHKRIAVFGTKGFVHWTMVGWERFTQEGGYESGTHSYGEQDVKAQASLTDAAFEWLEDDNKPHPTRLEHSLTQFNIILGAYVSALEHRPVELPIEPPNGLMDALEARLSS